MITGQSRQILFEWLLSRTQDLHRFFRLLTRFHDLHQQSVRGRRLTCDWDKLRCKKRQAQV